MHLLLSLLSLIHNREPCASFPRICCRTYPCNCPTMPSYHDMELRAQPRNSSALPYNSHKHTKCPAGSPKPNPASARSCSAGPPLPKQPSSPPPSTTSRSTGAASSSAPKGSAHRTKASSGSLCAGANKFPPPEPYSPRACADL